MFFKTYNLKKWLVSYHYISQILIKMLQRILLNRIYGKNIAIEQLGRNIVFSVLNGGVTTCKPQKYYDLYNVFSR